MLRILTVPIRAAALACALAAAPLAYARAQAPAPGLVIRDDRARHEMIVEVGPADLPNGEMKQLPAFHGTFPVDGWLHGYRVEMVNVRGQAVDRQTLHHVNVVLPNRRELFSQIMLRLAAAGQETAPAMLPRMLGYRVHRGEPVIVTVMMTNPTGRDLQGVKLRLHFPYTAAGALLRPVSIFPFYVDVMPPASLHSWDLPPGHSTRSWEGRPAVAGRIVGIGGHLHKYGVALSLTDVTAGRVIWTGRPTLDRDGEVVGMPMKKFIWSLGVPVRPDHLYRVTAEYDNPTGETIPEGAMGALGGAFMPEDAARWPAVDPRNPELRLDWHLVHTGNQGEMHMHMGGEQHGALQHASMPGTDHGAMQMGMPMDHGHMQMPMPAPPAPPRPRHR